LPAIITAHEAQTIRGCMGLLAPALRGLSPDQAMFRIGGQGSNIHWNAGHLVWSLDDVGVVLGLPSSLPSHYPALFATGTTPLPAPGMEPSLAELLEHSSATTASVAAFIETLDDEALFTPIPAENPLSAVYPDWRELIASSGFHIGFHLGQISLLRRVQGIQPVF